MLEHSTVSSPSQSRGRCPSATLLECHDSATCATCTVDWNMTTASSQHDRQQSMTATGCTLWPILGWTCGPLHHVNLIAVGQTRHESRVTQRSAGIIGPLASVPPFKFTEGHRIHGLFEGKFKDTRGVPFPSLPSVPSLLPPPLPSLPSPLPLRSYIPFP